MRAFFSVLLAVVSQPVVIFSILVVIFFCVYANMVATVNIIIGTFYTFTSVLLFLVNAVVLFTLLRHAEFHTNTYRIIKNMLAGCLMQLMSHFVGGLMTLCDSNLSASVERVAGAWIQSGWFLYLGASLALAVERALTFMTLVKDRQNILVSLGFLIFSWVVAAVYLVGLNIPGFGFTYQSDHGYFDWFYDKQPATQSFLTMEVCIDFAILAAVLLLYFLVFIRIFMMRRKTSAGITSSTTELRILGIAVISFLYESTYLLWFFWGTHLMERSIFSSVIVQTLWIFDCGLFSLATIFINSSIRRKIQNPFHKSNHTATVTTVRAMTKVALTLKATRHK